MLDDVVCWAFVPARGGSKSIKLKNLVEINSKPLLDYGISASIRSQIFSRIIVSTDSKLIAERARYLGVEVDDRPSKLCDDDVAVIEVVREFIARQKSDLPDIIFLIQPTSPFILKDHLIQLRELMVKEKSCVSGQSVTKIPHNYHSWNQRVVHSGYSKFFYKKERKDAFNKQRKPLLYSFGNVTALKIGSINDEFGFFSEPSCALEIKWPYNIDVDIDDDVKLANALLKSKCVDNELLK
jgi:CMP-N,N'-diacetyllegionaminic acid synthase